MGAARPGSSCFALAVLGAVCPSPRCLWPLAFSFIDLSLPRLWSFHPSMLSGYLPASRAPPGSPVSQFLDFCALPPAWLPTIRMCISLLPKSVRFGHSTVSTPFSWCVWFLFGTAFLSLFGEEQESLGVFPRHPSILASHSILTATEFYTQGVGLPPTPDPVGPAVCPPQYYFPVPSHR